MTRKKLDDVIEQIKASEAYKRELYVTQNNVVITGYLLESKNGKPLAFFPYSSKWFGYYFDWGVVKKFGKGDNYDVLGIGQGKIKLENFDEIEDVLERN